MTHNRKRILALMQEHGLHASRALGQNFMADPNSVRRMARLADVGKGDNVLEVGAGLGSLTLALAETGATVKALEVDRYLLPALRASVGDAAEIVEGDAMKADWDQVVPRSHRWVLVANLPYNVGTHVLTNVLETAPQVVRLVVLLQREVAQRIAAGVGHDAYGALSVKVRYHADARILATVPPTVFVPKPAVESAIVEVSRLSAVRVPPSDVSEPALFAVVNQAFGQRRKMLRHTLAGVVSTEAFDAAGIAPTARPEELDVTDWGRLVSCRAT